MIRVTLLVQNKSLTWNSSAAGNLDHWGQATGHFVITVMLDQRQTQSTVESVWNMINIPIVFLIRSV